MKSSLLLLLFGLALGACNSQRPAKRELREGSLRVHGSDIYYRVLGTGEPLLIVHGGPLLDHSYLLPSFEALADEYQLIFYDQRACGRSSAAVDTAQMSMSTFVADIEALREALDLGPIHLLGHSWGGLLAMQYAAEYPGQLRSLILSNSMPATSEAWQKEEAALARRITKADSALRETLLGSREMEKNPAKAIEKLLRLSFKPQFFQPRLLDSLPLYVPDDYLARSRAFSQLGPDLAGYNLEPALSRLRLPVLLLYGSHEPAAELSGPRLAKLISQAELTVIKHAGHFPFIEQPKAYFGRIRAFLAK